MWCRPDGGPVDPKLDREEWRRIQDQAGVRHSTGRHFHGHENRHTTITLLKELGVEDEVIEKIVGQSRLVKSYVHQNMRPRTRDALEQLASTLALGGAPTP